MENEVIEVYEEEKLSPIGYLTGIFVSPNKVFKAIKGKPRILLPLILLPIVVLGFYLIFFSSFKETIITSIESSIETQLANSDVEISQEFIDMQVKVGLVAGMVFALVMPILGILFGALYYFIAAKIVKGDLSFKKSISLVAHANLITILSYVVIGLVSWLNGTFALGQPITSLATFLPASMNMSFLYGVLANFDIFTIWTYILIALGLIEIAQLTKKQAYIITGIAFSAVTLYTGFSLLISSLMLNMGSF